MERVSLQFLDARGYGEQIVRKEYRMGFHGPGHNSQDHLHLHLIIPPFIGTIERQIYYDKVKYGNRLVSIEDVIRLHDSKN